MRDNRAYATERVASAPGSEPRAVRIAHLITGGEIGGAQNNILQLLGAMDRKRFANVMVCPVPSPFADRVRDIGIPVHNLPISKQLRLLSRQHLTMSSMAFTALTSPSTLSKWKAVIRSTCADIVHTHDLKTHIFGGLAARLTGRSTLWHVRDIEGRATIRKVLRTLSHPLASRIIAVSNAVENAYGFKRTSVIHNAIDVSRFGGKSTVLPATLPWPGPIIGTVAHMAPIKGVDIFVDACTQIAAADPKARFLVVGGPIYSTAVGSESYFQDIQKKAAKLGLANRMLFTGAVADVRPFLASMDVFLLCSRSEAFGLSAIEAMSMGVPAVVSRVGGLPEIVEDGVSGFLATVESASEFASRAIQLLRNDQLRGQMTTEGRKRVHERFALPALVNRISSIYESMAIERKPITMPASS